jgi:hypothetical protein
MRCTPSAAISARNRSLSDATGSDAGSGVSGGEDKCDFAIKRKTLI